MLWSDPMHSEANRLRVPQSVKAPRSVHWQRKLENVGEPVSLKTPNNVISSDRPIAPTIQHSEDEQQQRLATFIESRVERRWRLLAHPNCPFTCPVIKRIVETLCSPQAPHTKLSNIAQLVHVDEVLNGRACFNLVSKRCVINRGRSLGQCHASKLKQRSVGKQAATKQTSSRGVVEFLFLFEEIQTSQRGSLLRIKTAMIVKLS